MEKYVSKKSDGIANCPHCRGVVFRDVKIERDDYKASLLMRCPHCQKEVAVTIVKGAVIIHKPGDGPKN